MRSKRRVATTLTVVLVCVMALILPAVALASSYYSSLEVTGGRVWKGANRFYNGTNVHISCDTHSKGDGNYKVTLFRHRTMQRDDKIGSVSMPRNGVGKKTWTNVGSGTYHFKFDNTSSKYTIYCDNNKVHMWSD